MIGDRQILRGLRKEIGLPVSTGQKGPLLVQGEEKHLAVIAGEEVERRGYPGHDGLVLVVIETYQRGGEPRQLGCYLDRCPVTRIETKLAQLPVSLLEQIGHNVRRLFESGGFEPELRRQAYGQQRTQDVAENQ